MFLFLQTTFLSVVRTPIHTHIHTTHTVFSHFHSYLLFLFLFSIFSLHFFLVHASAFKLYFLFLFFLLYFARFWYMFYKRLVCFMVYYPCNARIKNSRIFMITFIMSPKCVALSIGAYYYYYYIRPLQNK